MQELTAMELEALYGEGWRDFLYGVGCGLAIVGSVAAAVSPEPFSKGALVAYGGFAISCLV